MIFTIGQAGLDEVMFVMDGHGVFWRHVTHLDTQTGDLIFVRIDARTGTPMLVKDKPKGLPPGAKVAQCSTVNVPTPITLTFAGPKEMKALNAGERPLTPLDVLISCKYEMDRQQGVGEAWRGDEDVATAGWFQQYRDRVSKPQEEPWKQSADVPVDKPEADTNRFSCPCCKQKMIETYSSRKKWYLKCTQCDCITIRTEA